MWTYEVIERYESLTIRLKGEQEPICVVTGRSGRAREHLRHLVSCANAMDASRYAVIRYDAKANVFRSECFATDWLTGKTVSIGMGASESIAGSLEALAFSVASNGHNANVNDPPVDFA